MQMAHCLLMFIIHINSFWNYIMHSEVIGRTQTQAALRTKMTNSYFQSFVIRGHIIEFTVGLKPTIHRLRGSALTIKPMLTLQWTWIAIISVTILRAPSNMWNNNIFCECIYLIGLESGDFFGSGFLSFWKTDIKETEWKQKCSFTNKLAGKNNFY
jgi:hypothetical protein